MIANFPFLDRVLSEEAYAAYQNALGPASAATLSIMGLFVIIGIGYKLTEHYGLEIYGRRFPGGFFISDAQVLENVTGVIPTCRSGAEGLFLGIFTSFIASELYRFFGGSWVIKMPAGVPDAVSRSFSALIPIALTLSSS